jgi:hypothetical protein
MFLNATDDKFFLMTDRVGRYALTGESRSNSQIKPSKHFRLLTFCSASITNNDFNMRIYCIDNLLVALQVNYLFFIKYE